MGNHPSFILFLHLIFAHSIPELVDSINLQAAGYAFYSPQLPDHLSAVPCSPTEASRALRKKLKHGNTHQQYRALVVRGYLSHGLNSVGT